MRLGSELTNLVRGLSFFVRFFLNFLGVLVTRKEVENGEVRKGLEGLGLGLGFKTSFRVLVRRKRQAMEVLELIIVDAYIYSITAKAMINGDLGAQRQKGIKLGDF
jgi:hypothetical protein